MVEQLGMSDDKIFACFAFKVWSMEWRVIQFVHEKELPFGTSAKGYIIILLRNGHNFKECSGFAS